TAPQRRIDAVLDLEYRRVPVRERLDATNAEFRGVGVHAENVGVGAIAWALRSRLLAVDELHVEIDAPVKDDAGLLPVRGRRAQQAGNDGGDELRSHVFFSARE